MNTQLSKNSPNPPSSKHPSHSHQSPCLEGALQAYGPLSSLRPLLGGSHPTSTFLPSLLLAHVLPDHTGVPPILLGVQGSHQHLVGALVVEIC